ncbi:MAG: thiamine pyrophosphate-binding protein [Clostridia bacterium]|nr:thiamine pyrophosphate-binding protein [Clostridia bacterium]
MKIKVANYISSFLVAHGIDTAFTVTGGGAMHLNDALGHQEGLRCVYNHHEQACAIAAEAYARLDNKIAAVCVTTGPGGTNAITGVVGGWLDSIPMLVISGQVRYDTTARSTGLGIRAMGDQEFDICKAVSSMTKYCEMVIDKNKIRYCLEKALHLATTGRPGPCWLDIPLNVQGAYVDTDDLYPYDGADNETLPPKPAQALYFDILEKIRHARRPVLNAGAGIRLSGAYAQFRALAKKLNIPVVTGWDSIDLLEDDHPLYTGRAGIMGDRAGNFAVQNSDLLLSIGSRLSIRQVGYSWDTWARAAYKIVVDVDAEELKKPTIHPDLPVWADAADFIPGLLACIEEESVLHDEDWLRQCRDWKKNYPVVLPRHFEEDYAANVYAFIKKLSDALPENRVTVVGNGSACVVGSHAYVMKKGSRFIINSAIASMGYDLPAAIGACYAVGGEEVILVTGDGSIQMNLQELQTIITNRLPIKIFMINNAGYHSIRQTQSNLFNAQYVGIGPESGDLSFPDMSKLAPAYGYPYFKASKNSELEQAIGDTLRTDAYAFCEIVVTTEQKFEPKSATKRLPDGTLVSPPLEDLAPFLPEDELARNMYIPMLEKK